jgi:hypothetical protein
MILLISCAAIWYGTIAVFDWPWVLLVPEVAFGLALWRAAGWAWPPVPGAGQGAGAR